MTIRLSVRVEFFEEIDPDGRGRGRAGSAVQEDAFEAVAMPRKGELVSVIGLLGFELAGMLRTQSGGFVQVAHVEHMPVSVPGETRTLSERDWKVPTAFVVLYLKAPTDDRSITKLNETLRSRGWDVLPD